MKKLNIFFTCVFLVVTLVSCEKKKVDEFQLSPKDIKKSSELSIDVNIPNIPVSDAGITPYIIPGDNRGGNRTCGEVALAFDTDFDLCGDKIDYEDNAFATGFPPGLNVSVDGIYISFNMDNCISIDGNYYKVGAVIVKGSNNANVYWYPNGTTSDEGLAAPEEKHMVSNLTFCFVECEEQPVFVIALKTYLDIPEWDGDDPAYAVSDGEVVPGDGLALGYNNYIFYVQNSYSLLSGIERKQIGAISATDYIENSIHYLEVVVDTDIDSWSFKNSYLYVGSLNGYESYLGDGLIKFFSFPFFEDEISGIRIFKIPFSSITE